MFENFQGLLVIFLKGPEGVTLHLFLRDLTLNIGEEAVNYVRRRQDTLLIIIVFFSFEIIQNI